MLSRLASLLVISEENYGQRQFAKRWRQHWPHLELTNTIDLGLVDDDHVRLMIQILDIMILLSIDNDRDDLVSVNVNVVRIFLSMDFVHLIATLILGSGGGRDGAPVLLLLLLLLLLFAPKQYCVAPRGKLLLEGGTPPQKSGAGENQAGQKEDAEQTDEGQPLA